MIGWSVLYYAQYDALEKTCASFCIKLCPDYTMSQKFYKDCFKIFPIVLALCLMLSETQYAQNYAGIIGLALLASLYSLEYNIKLYQMPLMRSTKAAAT